MSNYANERRAPAGSPWKPFAGLGIAIVVLAIVLFWSWGATKTGSGETRKQVESDMKLIELTPEEERVIVHKGTEAPFTGEFYQHHEKGSYHCKRCGAELFRSVDKFESSCGWPSFDDAVPEAVKEIPDSDGRRTEIICQACDGHLGHVFAGEGLTAKNVRHCVNSVSLDFVPAVAPATETAYFAGGCFWGVEYYLQQATGVISARNGYMGGAVDEPDYQEVCEGTTGHAEAVKVVFDQTRTDFETLARLFFEIHDPTQIDRQGPDIGKQYRSAVFFTDDSQRQIIEHLISLLQVRGFAVATELVPAGTFWAAEEYHQDYYGRNGHTPYCHVPQKRF